MCRSMSSRPADAERLEIGRERHSRQVALQIVLVLVPPVGGVHHAVQILPNVVFRDGLVAVVGLELGQAPIGDVVAVA